MADLHDIKDRKPNPLLIEHLEYLLKRAKSGELRSLFYVSQFDDDNVNHSWSLDWRSHRRMMLAEMVMAQHNFVINMEMREKDSVLCGVLGVEEP